MREVAIIGIGQTAVGELWEMSLRELGARALRSAMADAGLDYIDAVYVGNMLSPRISAQAQVGALVVDFAGLRGVEAATIEAACASGGAAMQVGVRAVSSGMVDVVAVVGVEKMTDATPTPTITALATAADAEFESIHGATFVALNALVMRRYMHEYNVPHEVFGAFSVNAHANAVNNPNAMFRSAISQADYERAPMISDPINRLDSAPICDGAAAVILCSLEMARTLGVQDPIRVLASASATDALALADRADLLALQAAASSAQKAYRMAGLTPSDIDLFEVHDAFSIMAALSLEASGFAPRGQAAYMARDGEFRLDGRLPIATMGGLKGRGHPVGATGVYELVDLVTQMRGKAGANQVGKAEIGMTQNIGGTGATIVTHILGH
jgi:acetyl-CoA C-acetyltransferase